MVTDRKSSLLFLSDIMSINIHSKKKIGFLEIQRVDKNTFTILSVDEEEFINNIDKELVNELSIEDDSKES